MSAPKLRPRKDPLEDDDRVCPERDRRGWLQNVSIPRERRAGAGVSSSRNDALDGLRLVAVDAVMAFHFGVPGASGGFLGVDVFFVLSGFLITSLLLTRMRQQQLDVIDWAGRLRRLLPALLVLMAVVVGWAALVAPPVSRDGLRGDITATLFYVANWHLITTSTYFASDGAPSPLEHMWSLAIEEQFYLVWPLLLLVVAFLVREHGRRVAAVGMIAAIGLMASAIRLGLVWASSGQDRTYLGTDSRIFEPLTGALLAALMASGAARRFVGRTGGCSSSAGSHWHGA
jgi:peptidoglycan/LPS O-acetylase OafA/YrhL